MVAPARKMLAAMPIHSKVSTAAEARSIIPIFWSETLSWEGILLAFLVRVFVLSYTCILCARIHKFT